MFRQIHVNILYFLRCNGNEGGGVSQIDLISSPGSQVHLVSGYTAHPFF